MKKNFKPNTWLYPQPVLVIASYGADGTADGGKFVIEESLYRKHGDRFHDGGSGLSGDRVGESCT